jgi:hypothetical protein
MSRRTLTQAPNPNQAPPVSIATRRDLFGTMGALLLLTAAESGTAKAPELDGELIAMCEEAMAIDRESNRLWDACPMEAEHPAWEAYHTHTNATLDRWHELVIEISAMPSRTPEGLRAKAAVARSAMPVDRADDGDPCDLLALSLYADMLGRAGA